MDSTSVEFVGLKRVRRGHILRGDRESNGSRSDVSKKAQGEVLLY